MGSNCWILRAATKEVSALGHHWLGEEHFLLGYLSGDPTGESQPALAALGLTHDSVAAALASRLERQGPPTAKQYEGALSSPSFHAVLGRAEGVALGLGDTALDDRHFLPAIFWDPSGTVAALHDDLGVTRAAVLDVLGDLGVRPPEMNLPNPLLPPSARQALSQEHSYISDDDVLLALLAGEPDDRAARLLNDLGLSYEGLAANVRERDQRSDPPAPKTPGATAAHPNAACRELLGRAEGFALTTGDGTVRSTDGLIANLWSQRGNAVLILEQLSVQASAVVTALVDMGVQVSTVPLPEPDRTPWGEPVDVPQDRLGDVISFLKDRLPVGSWGCNTHEERAWVMAYADIDLQTLVDEALATG